jgi:hypothetical protein
MAYSCDEADCWYQAIGQGGVCENKTGEGCPLTYPLVADSVGQAPATKADSAKQTGVPRVNESRSPCGMTVAALAATLGKSPDTVKDDIRKLYPGVMVSGRTTYLNAEQVAALVARRRRLDESRREKTRGTRTAGL